MNAYQAAIFANILACQARIEGMKAENQQRIQCGESVAYDANAFYYEAQTLDTLANEMRAAA